MGKLLKVVLDEHRSRGTDILPEYPPGAGLTISGACLVFDYPPADSNRPTP